MLTLVVPIFNKEQYLPRCIDSLLAQTVRDCEILLIDDGSADGSGAICDAYAAAHPERIRVIHKPNGGLSSARNAGIEAARGEWITFPDPDDWVEPEYVETFLELRNTHRADLICAGFWVDEGGKRYPGYASAPTQTMTAEAGRRALLLPPRMGGFSWNKCYRMELLRRHGLHPGDGAICLHPRAAVPFQDAQVDGWFPRRADYCWPDGSCFPGLLWFDLRKECLNNECYFDQRIGAGRSGPCLWHSADVCKQGV